MDYFSDLTFALCGEEVNTTIVTRNYPSYYGLQYVHAGSFSLRINGSREYRLTGPVAFLTNPAYYYEYGNLPGSQRHHIWCCFYGERMKRMLAGELFADSLKTPYFNIQDPENFLRQFRQLCEHAVSPVGVERAVMCLENLLFQLHDASGQSEEKVPYKGYFDTLLEEIGNDPLREWDFQKEAQKLSLCLNYYNRLFRSYCRTSPHHAVLCAKLRFAAKNLIETRSKIYEIAELCGFANEFYFSRLFKRYYAISPQAYRDEFSTMKEEV